MGIRTLALAALALTLASGCHRKSHKAEAAEAPEADDPSDMALRRRHDAGVHGPDGGGRPHNLPDAGVVPRRDAGMRPPDGPPGNLPDGGLHRPKPHLPPRPIPRSPLAPL